MTLLTLGDEGPLDEPADGNRRQPGPLLIGCGVLLALLGVAALLLMVRGEGWIRGILAWSLGTVQQEVSAALPEDLTAAERKRLRAAFAAARAAIREDEEIDIAAVQALQPVILEVSRSVAAGSLTRRQCVDLAEALERVASARLPSQSAMWRATQSSSSSPDWKTAAG